MKYEVIGWTSYESTEYPEIDECDEEKYYAARLAVVEEVKKNGFAFGGDAHQYRDGCAPVLNSGEIFRFSWRGWGALMAEAHEENNESGMAYMNWYMMGYYDEEDEQDVCYPKAGVDKSKIVKNGVFETNLPVGYEPY